MALDLPESFPEHLVLVMPMRAALKAAYGGGHQGAVDGWRLLWSAMLLNRLRTTVDADHSQYGLVDRDSGSGPEFTTGGTGLIGPQGDVAVVCTGTEYGPVRLTVEAHDGVPLLDLHSWDEIVESGPTTGMPNDNGLRRLHALWSCVLRRRNGPPLTGHGRRVNPAHKCPSTRPCFARHGLI
jgi:hypothetical protein